MPFSFLHTQPWLLNVIPFLMVASDRRQVSFNWADLIKTLLVAGIVAGVTMYGTQRATEKDIDYMKAALSSIRSDVSNLSAKVDRIAAAQNEMIGRETVRDNERVSRGIIRR